MTTQSLVLLLSATFLLSACGSKTAESPGAEPRDVTTGLSAAECRKEPDKSDPNETPYQVCPGPAGYTLIVRKVEAGRQSIDVLDPQQRAFPLQYQEVVTRHMATLGQKAEWRVTARDGKPLPISLTVLVHAREDSDQPEKVTQSYLAIAKITPSEVCVTDKLPVQGNAESEARRLADTARERPCAKALPPLAGMR